MIRMVVLILVLLVYATPFADVRKHPERSVGGVSVQVLKWAEECAIERLGSDVVNESVFLVGWDLTPPDCSGCSWVSFEMRPVEYPSVNVDFVVCIDSVGGCVGLYGSVPNCDEDPTLCEFPISRAQAEEIAREAGVGPGLVRWPTQLLPSSDKNSPRRLNWYINSVVSDRIRKVAEVDSYTGELLEIKEWLTDEPHWRCATDSIWAAAAIAPVEVVTNGRIEYRTAPRTTAKVAGLLRRPTKLTISDFVAGYYQTTVAREPAFIADEYIQYNSELEELRQLAKCHLERKYGQRDGWRIANGVIWEGMTTDMARDSWGEPLRIVETIGTYRAPRARWVYECCLLDFERDRLYNIENR